MNAYSHFFTRSEPENAPALRYAPLTEPQIEFLNPCTCRYVSPYSLTFWSELRSKLCAYSKTIQELPKADGYRSILEPYLFQRVHMTARTWSVHGLGDNQIHLVLQDILLTGIHGDTIGSAPGIVLDHLNIWVSPLWLNRVVPVWGEPLLLDGIIHEYDSSRHTRNIGLLPVLIMPRTRKLRAGPPTPDRAA